MRTFKITEIFYSVQGEGPMTGYPCIFIRLHGCNLRCSWCDTPYAQDINTPAVEMNSEEIMKKVSAFECRYIEFTGGEPLLQKGASEMINFFDENGYHTSVETNGSYDISKLNPSVLKVVDIKCPASGMSKNNNFENLQYLNQNDAVKFVIGAYDDFLWAEDVYFSHSLHEICDVYFSPASGKVKPAELALWLLKERLHARLQLQLHKYIWDPGKKGV